MSFILKMLEMLTSAYNRSDISVIKNNQEPKTNIGKLFHLAGWGFDLIKDQAEKVRLWDDIDKAEGKVLDRYGANFGVNRGSASDELYRIMIKVKTISMLSAGNLDSIMSAAASLFGIDVTGISVNEIFPAKIYLYINEADLDEEHKAMGEAIASLMNRITASGVGSQIVYKSYPMYEQKLYTAIPRVDFVQISYLPDKEAIWQTGQ